MGFHTRMNYSRWKLSSPKSQSQRQPNVPAIYRLPDDVLLSLFLCPEFDFTTLYMLAQSSPRFRPLVCQALKCYLLPNVQLTTMIDQEGRGKWTCRYTFASFDDASLRATFIPTECNNYYKRYRCDGSTDMPTLRYLEADYNTESTSLLLKDTRYYRETTAIEPQCIVRQTRNVGIKRCGVRSVKSRQIPEKLAAKISNTSFAPSWHLSYLVSTELPPAASAGSDNASRISSVSLPTEDGNNKQSTHSRHFNAYKDKRAARYVVPLRLSIDISMLGQRSSNAGYKRLFNHYPLCWLRRKLRMNKQSSAASL